MSERPGGRASRRRSDRHRERSFGRRRQPGGRELPCSAGAAGPGPAVTDAVRRWPRSRDDGHGDGPAARQGRRTSAARCADCSATLAAGAAPDRRSSSCSRRQRDLRRHRPEDPRRGDQPDLRGRAQQADPRQRGDPGTGRSPAAGAGPGPARRHAVRHAAHAGQGSTSGRSPDCSASWSASTCSARSSAGSRATSWPASPSGRSSGCATMSTASSAGCRSRYFDSHPRGDLLSRVTNDIDNIGQSLQQSLTQLITSLLTIVGVLDPDAHDQPAPCGHLAARACRRRSP